MPGTVTAPPPFSVSNWRPYARNTLIAFCSLTTSSGLVLNECSFHCKSDSKWISLPSRKFEKDGKVGYVPLIEFASKQAKECFQQRAIAAVVAFLAGGGR